MKNAIILFILCLPILLRAQPKQGKACIDSLLKEVSRQKNDTDEVRVLNEIARNFNGIDVNEGIRYANQALSLSQHISYKKGMADAYADLARCYRLQENTSEALKDFGIALKLYEELGKKHGMANCYYGIATMLSSQGRNEEAIQDINIALKLFEQENEKNSIGNCYGVLCDICFSQGKYREALDYENHALELYKQTGQKNGIANCYYYFGQINNHLGNYPEAIKNAYTAIKIYEPLGQKQGAAACYNIIGEVNEHLGNHDQALSSYDSSVRIMDEAGMQPSKNVPYQNIGTVYFDEGNYPEAMVYYKKALAICRDINDKNCMGNCYYIFGSINEREKNYPEALSNYFRATELYGQVNCQTELAGAYTGIGNVYYDQKKYAYAKTFGTKALATASKTGSLEAIKNADTLMSSISAAMRDYKSALQYYRAYVIIKDSMYNEEATKKIVRDQMRYDFEKKEAAAKSEQQKKDSETKLQLQRKNMLIYASLSALIALVVIGAMLMRQRKLKANQQKTELEQKQPRAQMNPHFIFNCLNSIQHFVVINDVKNANKYLTGFASLMRQTLENSRDGIISLQKELAYLDNYLTLELMRFKDKFTVEIICADDINTSAIKIPSMIIQPFVENSIRHGLCFLKEKTGRLTIRFYLKGDILYCEIDDNGIGRAQSQKLKEDTNVIYESQGMALTKQRLALVSKSSGSEYTITIIDKVNKETESEGTTVIIKFPVEI